MDVTCLTTAADTFTGHVYLVRGSRPTLVDAGAMPGVVDAVRERVSTLDQVLLTHRHEDHVEQLPALREAFDPTVYAADPLDGAVELDDGDTVPAGDGQLEAVATPGHAPDHLAFLGAEALFSGDVVVASDGAFDDGSFGRTDIPGADRETLIESLDRLLDRVPDTVDAMYPGHGPPAQGDVRGVIGRARGRAARREAKYD
jgi:glyoxylase-like metal-dependent hydrolase (beta-lactamase superfamily II)